MDGSLFLLLRLVVNHPYSYAHVSLTPPAFSCLQVDITVQFKPNDDSTYELQWKLYNESEYTKSVAVVTPEEVVATPLEPGQTYCVRLVGAGGEASKELIVDTEQLGCTPDKKSCCVIL